MSQETVVDPIEQVKAKEAELAKVTTAVEETKALLKQKDRELASMREVQSLRKTLEATGVRFRPTDADVLKLLQGVGGATLSFNETGEELIVEQNGKKVNPVEFIQDFALSNRYLADERTLRHLRTKDDIKSKADLKTTKEKIEFIEKHGLAKFENLPSHAAGTLDVETMTASEWRKLRPGDKSALISKHGAHVVELILRRPD